MAERCRDAIGGKCSIGVAAWHDGLDADGLLEQADRALMLAKRTGKGRVAVANPEVERELALLQSRSGSPAAVQALAAAIEERDNYTHEHSQQLVRLSRGVSMMLGLASEHVERIAHAALLHDVGKLAMPEELLEKNGPLTRDEWEVMTEHPIVGERILARTKELARLAPIVRHEHEHWDGTGYPDGLERQRIPIGSRVILACHAYVAMTHRAALPPGAVGRAGAQRAARRRELQVRPRRRRRAAGPARPGPRRCPIAPPASSSPRRRRASPSAAGLRVRIGYRAGDQRRRVDQPRLVEAAVLRDEVERHLSGLRRECRRTCPRHAPARHELWSVSSGVSAGAQVGTVRAMT